MANISDELTSSPWSISVCIKKNTFGLYFCYFIMTLCFFLGVAAHSWCLWLYFSVDLKTKQIQWFVLNHIIMDLILCIECPLEILNAFIFNNNGIFLLVSFLFGFSWTGRPLMQICICFQQYVAVLHPITFLKYKGIKYRVPITATVWMIASGGGLYFMYGREYYYISVSVFFIAVPVISFCWFSMLHALKHHGPGDNQTGRDVGSKQKKNAFNTVLTALLVVLLTYIPEVLILIFVFIKDNQILFKCNIEPFVMSINLLGVIVTPFMSMYKEGYLKCGTCQKKI